MKRRTKVSDAKADREAERSGLIGPPLPQVELPTCCSKALHGGCEHMVQKRRQVEFIPS
jgi:hypothetical protein